MTAPMEGVRVLDLSEGYEGYTGQMLAEFGASVTKVEPPAGDHMRLLGPPFIAGESAAFMGVNRGKRSLALAWQEREDARRVLDRLIAESDVLLTTFYADEVELVGLTYEAVLAINAGIVYCSITPMGDAGPYANQRASDLEVQGMFGHWRYLGEPKFHRTKEPPLRLGVPVAAMNAAVFAYQGVTAALIHRHRTGQGQKVAISKAASLIAMKNIQFAAESEPDEYEGHNVGHLRPPFHGTKTNDRLIYWGFSGSDATTEQLAAAVGLGDLVNNPEFKGDLKEQIDQKFGEMPAEEAMSLIRENGGAVVYYNTFEGVSKDPQAIAMGMTAQFEHATAGPVGTTGLPWWFSETPPQLGSPPVLGQHSIEVLRDLGLSEAEVTQLIDAGAVHQPQL